MLDLKNAPDSFTSQARTLLVGFGAWLAGINARLDGQPYLHSPDAGLLRSGGFGFELVAHAKQSRDRGRMPL